MTERPSRRRLLELVGTSTAALVAGCTGSLSGGDEPTDGGVLGPLDDAFDVELATFSDDTGDVSARLFVTDEQ